MINTHKQQTLIENMTMWNDVIEEKLNQGLIESIDCVYADCYQHTGPGGFTGKGTEMLKQANQSVRSAFPDIHISNDIFGQGDRAVNYFTIEGTHLGSWQGIEPTGRRISVRGIALVRFYKGQIVEECEYFDELTLLKQLGLFEEAEDTYSIFSLLKRINPGPSA